MASRYSSLHEVIVALNPAASFTMEGNTYGGITWRNGFTPISEAAIDAKRVELEAGEAMDVLREYRTQLLADSDWMAVGDRTMTKAQTDYRQELRDLPESDLSNLELDNDSNVKRGLTGVNWPTEP